MNGQPAGKRRAWRAPRLRLAISALAVLASSAAGLVATASGASAATTTCGFANAGSGTYAQTLCWFNLSGYDASLATSGAGQPFTVNLPSGYTLTFTLNLTGSAVKAATLPTYSAAFLGRGGYTGIPGDPALYQTASGSTTATESAITLTDPGGNVVTDYSLVGADAESTDNGEHMTWTSAPNTLSSLEPLGNSCAGGFAGVGTTSVTCTGSSTGGKTGAAILASIAPTTFTQQMTGTGLEAFGFGVLVSGVELNKTVVNGFTGDSFGITATNGAGTVIGSANTGGGSSASTGVVTLITTSGGEVFTLAESATAGTLANYDGSWSCTRNGATDPTLPSGNAGTSATVTLGVGDLVDCTITNTAKAAGLALTKHAATPVDVNNDGLVDAGDTIAYSFTVTNNGVIQIDNVGVTDSKVGPVTCPQPTLAAGDSETCTADSLYTITAADVTAGSVHNTATASGDVDGSSAGTVTSPPSSTTTPTTAPAPSLSMTKSVSPTSVSAAGQGVTYSFLITNTGNVTITGVAVNELSFSGTGAMSAVSCPPGAASLAPGDHVTCTATYTVTQADMDVGSVVNTADATGTDPASATVTSPTSTSTLTATANPSLSIVKSASPAGAPVLHVGDLITYSFVITNTGNVTITDATVDEGAFTGTGTLSPATCPPAAASLAPGDQVTCTATYHVTQADVDAGTLSNTATATGTPPVGVPGPITSPPSTVVLPETAQPALTLVKSAAPTSMPAVGQSITYSFVITNTGNVTITDVTVDEGAFTGAGTLSPASCPLGAASLAPGDQLTCTATYVVTQADIDSGSISNTATATGTPPAGVTGPIDSPPSTVVVTANQQPALTVVKSASPSTMPAVGQTITYSFVITNTGNVTITDVSIDEGTFTGAGTLSTVTCPSGAATLAPGDQVTCTATYLVTQADIDADSISNTATATGTPPPSIIGPIDSPPSTVVVTGNPQPGLTLVKSASPTIMPAVGNTITYSFLITNTGNVTITDVTVDDSAFSGTGTLSAINCPAGVASLAPGDQVTCTATYTVTQADIDAGGVDNTATAIGTPPAGIIGPIDSPPSTVVVPNTAEPALTLVKSASPTTVTAVGQTVTYSFLITNTGNVTITDAAVNEGAFTGTGTLSAVNCPAGAASLAPGDQVTCTATYVVTQADLDAGTLSNTATATGTPPVGITGPITSPPSTVAIPETSAPALTVLKTATPTTVSKVGQKVAYSFLITNTGDVTISHVTASETHFTGSGTLSAVSCPAGANSLAPGAQVTCMALYTVTQHDLNAGSISNTATATGKDPAHAVITSPPSSAKVTSTATSKLGLVKTAHAVDLNHDNVTDQGDRIDWKLVVTNLGATTVMNITVSDPSAGAVTCPRTTLAPGDDMTCTVASHLVTAQDAVNGHVVNVAIARGTVLQTVTVRTARARAAVTIERTPKPGTVLPFTGLADTLPMTALGIGLVLLGGLMLLAAVTRRRTS